MCEVCGWFNCLERIQDLLENVKAEFAHETLEGIHDWVEENSHITEKQIVAVTNIENCIGSRC